MIATHTYTPISCYLTLPNTDTADATEAAWVAVDCTWEVEFIDTDRPKPEPPTKPRWRSPDPPPCDWRTRSKDHCRVIGPQRAATKRRKYRRIARKKKRF